MNRIITFGKIIALVSAATLIISVKSHAGFLSTEITIEQYQEMRTAPEDHPLKKHNRILLENRVAGIYYTLQSVNFRQKLSNKNVHYCMPPETPALDVKAIMVDLDNEIKHNKNYYPKMKLTDGVIKLIMRRNPC